MQVVKKLELELAFNHTLKLKFQKRYVDERMLCGHTKCKVALIAWRPCLEQWTA